MLETAEDVEVELYISYVVSKAKWSPKYDIRVFSNDNTMKVRQQNVLKGLNGIQWEVAYLLTLNYRAPTTSMDATICVSGGGTAC